uniref:CASP8 and FADD like apoptosis regulator n=1 Tax=Leptobrachium leishanense TaxID=445787 RepID=A0A8C5Q6V8_9ANUR
MAQNPYNAQLLHIEEELDQQEIEEMLYVTRDVSPSKSIRQLLSDLNERFILQPTVFAELFYVVKRFDLLRKFLDMSKPEAESLLMAHKKLFSEYRITMVEIHEELNESDLDSLHFLLKSQLKSGTKIQKMTFLSLAIELEKMNLLGPDNLKLLDQSLQTIRRVDLQKKLRRKMSLGKEHVYRRERNGEKYQIRQPGFGLIIDCVGNDAGETFGCDVQKHMYSTTKDIKQALKNVSNMEQLCQYAFLVCFVISRGKSDAIFGVDEKFPEISLDTIKSYFNGGSCPYLAGKPKLFFIQHYVTQQPVLPEGESASGMLEVDGPVERNLERDQRKHWRNTIPSEADIFLSHCKVDENELQQSPSTGSLYLRSLRKDHLLDIHTELNSIVYREQPDYSIKLKHTLTKKLYFPS